MKSLKIYIITSLILYFCLTGCTKINTHNISGNALGTIYYININSDKNIDINSIKKNISFIKIREPGGNLNSEKIRKLILKG